MNEFLEKRKGIIGDIYQAESNLKLINEDQLESLKKQLEGTDFLLDTQYRYYTLIKKISKEDKEILNNLVKKVKESEHLKSIEDAMAERRVEIAKERFRAMGEIVSPRSTLKSRLEAVRTFKGLGSELKRLSKLSKMSGKSLSLVSSAFQVLGGALKNLGPLGILAVVISGIVKAVQTISDMDKFLKQFNKTFLKLQGPTVLMKDVSTSMKKFRDSIFDLNLQLRYGLRAEEIENMFSGVAGAGMSLQGILTRVSGGYSRIIEEAAKTHLNFGVTMEEAGSMLGEQMTDLQASIDDVVDSFKVLSYDAAKAGIQSQKFYQATYAAAESLSYYGNFLKAASNTLKNFQEQGAMGFKDAQKQAQETIELFKNMDKNIAIAFMEMTGGVESYRKEFEKLSEKFSKEIEQREQNIKMKEEELRKATTEEEINRIKQEIEVEKNKLDLTRRRYAQASSAAKSDALNMAMYLELLSDKTTEKLGTFFSNLKKEQGIDVFDVNNTRVVVEMVKKLTGTSDDYAMKMIDTFRTMKVSASSINKEFEEMFKKLPTEDMRSEARKKLLDLINSGIKDGRMNMNAIEEAVTTYSRQQGLDADVIMKNLEKYPSIVMDLLEKGSKATEKDLEEIVFKGIKPIEKVTGETSREEAIRLDDLVKNTATIEELAEIQKEYAKYVVANSEPMRAMAQGIISMERSTGAILNEVEKIRTGKDKGTMTHEDFLKSKLFGELEDIFARELIGKKELENVKKSLEALESKKEKTEEDLDKIKKLSKEKQKIESSLYLLESLKYLKGGDKYKQYYHEVIPGAQKKAEQIEQYKESALTEVKAGYASIEDVEKKLKKKYGDIYSFASIKPVTPKEDYKVLNSGYALLSKGDIVVNAKNISKGIEGGFGDFTGMGITELLRGIKPTEKTVAPSIPVNITIGSINGNPEEFLKKIKPAIEQTFERMFFEKQKRK
jgi:hypothetical protein